MTLTLRQAVTIARDKNPSLQESRERIIQYEDQIPVTRALIFPNINLLTTAGYNKDAANLPGARFGGDPYNAYETDLRLTQPIFAVGILSGISAAQKDRDMRKLETEAARRDLSNNVLAAFYQVSLYARNVETLERQQKIEREAVGVATSRAHTGRAQLLDVLQAKTQVALLDPQISDARNTLQIAVATLSNLMGDLDAKQVQIHSELKAPTLADVDRSVDLKTARLPELEKDRVAIEQVEDQKRVALGQNLPSVSLQADYTYASPKKSDLFDDGSKAFGVSLELTIPIFSGLSSIYTQRVLSSQQTQLELDRVNLRSQFNLQQVSSRKKLETAEASIRSGEDALKLAVASSNEANRNFRLATIDFVQYLQVQQAYVQAEQALNLSKYNYLVALGNYFVASGQDLDILVALIEKGTL